MEADIPDHQLIARIQQGDRATFGWMVTQHTPYLLRLAYAVLKSRADAEDVVQEIFLTVWRIRSRWQPQGAVASYLALAVRRRALDLLKHRRVESAYAEHVIIGDETDPEHGHTPAPDTMIAASDDRALVQAALAQLSERFRLILLLRYEQQRSFADIAEILEISPPAARQLAHRALDRLRQLCRI